MILLLQNEHSKSSTTTLILIHEINIAIPEFPHEFPSPPSQFVRLCLVPRASTSMEISQSTRSWKILERQISRENSLPYLSPDPENFENIQFGCESWE